MPTAKAKTASLSTLSDDARGVLGVHFSLISYNGRLIFQTPWNRSERGAAALYELESAGFIHHVVGDDGLWAWTYRRARDFDHMAAWKWVSRHQTRLAGLTLMRPDAERSERPPKGWSAKVQPAKLSA